MPITAFVLVVAVAMGCAVWSPIHEGSFQQNKSILRPFGMSRSLRQYNITGETETGVAGLGISFHVTVYKATAVRESQPDTAKFVTFIGRSGLPIRCMRWSIPADDGWIDSSVFFRGVEVPSVMLPNSTARRIPLMPEPLGMVLNVLIVSAAIVLPRLAWRHVVASRRKRKSLCSNCAYPLGGFAFCPECGNPTGRKA